VLLSEVAAQILMKTGGASERKRFRPHPALPGREGGGGSAAAGSCFLFARSFASNSTLA
jgi:hypothetical protein